MVKTTSPIVIHLKTQSGAFIASALTSAYLDVSNINAGSITSVSVSSTSFVV